MTDLVKRTSKVDKPIDTILTELKDLQKIKNLEHFC